MNQMKFIAQGQTSSSSVTLGRLTVNTNAEGYPINIGSNDNCATLFNEFVEHNTTVTPLTGGIVQADGWRALGNANFCAYFYMENIKVIRIFIYNPERMTFGAPFNNNVLAFAEL